MFISTTENFPGRTIEPLGLVKGSTVQAKHMGKDIMAGFKNMVGGELKGYSELLQESREIAIQRMNEEAEKMGANGIIGVRFATSSIMDGAAEVMAYGTAVRFV